MKLTFLAFFFTLFAISVSAVVLPLKPIIVSYPDNTPNTILTQAKNAIEAAGGVITHEYKLFKGFAARANAKAITTIQALGEQYNALIEEDDMVSVSGSGTRP